MPGLTLVAALAAVTLICAACASAGRGPQPVNPSPSASDAAALSETQFPDPPPIPDGPVDEALVARVADTFDNQPGFDHSLAATLVDAGDPRILWLVSDQLRFAEGPDGQGPLVDVASALTGVTFDADDFIWGELTNLLIAWDLPAFDEYRELKGRIFTFYEPAWEPFFADEDAEIDWRLVSWGGVLIDDRPLGSVERCARGCIPSLDNPALVDAAEGRWYPDDGVVFGVQIGDDVVAFPKNIMEVHEMVNMTLGGRQVAIPYCTLCASAQVFLTDVEGGGTGDIVMRTSGLLRRSNKVMYDLTSRSVFDTFTGQALSGPLHDDGVVLDQVTVVTSTWGAWRAAHPDTRIVAQDGGIGRTYGEDPLRGRDDGGPIFPIGEVDPRLGVQDEVLGIALPGGGHVAFDVRAAHERLDAGETVTFDGVEVRGEGDGLIALLDGRPVPSHQAWWFAWSQFHPQTRLWPADA